MSKLQMRRRTSQRRQIVRPPLTSAGSAASRTRVMPGPAAALPPLREAGTCCIEDTTDSAASALWTSLEAQRRGVVTWSGMPRPTSLKFPTFWCFMLVSQTCFNTKIMWQILAIAVFRRASTTYCHRRQSLHCRALRRLTLELSLQQKSPSAGNPINESSRHAYTGTKSNADNESIRFNLPNV